MNTLPPGSGSPLGKKTVYGCKRHLKFLDQADSKNYILWDRAVRDLSSNLGALEYTEISSSSMVVTSFVCIEAITEALSRLPQ